MAHRATCSRAVAVDGADVLVALQVRQSWRRVMEACVMGAPGMVDAKDMMVK
jgi:hypothetical protein